MKRFFERFKKPAKPTCWVFGCYDYERVQGMSMFMGHFYSEENIVNMVRNNLKIPDVIEVKYVAPSKWEAPDIKARQNSFDCNMDEIDNKVNNYLISKTGCNADKPKNAMKTTMAYANAGLLLVLVNMN